MTKLKKMVGIVAVLLVIGAVFAFADSVCFFTDGVTIRLTSNDKYVSFENSSASTVTVKYQVIYVDGSKFGPTTIAVPKYSTQIWKGNGTKIQSVEQCW